MKPDRKRIYTGKAKDIILGIIPAIFMTFAFLSCEKNKTENGTVTRTIAVVLPMQDGLDRHWKRTAGFFLEEYRRGSRAVGSDISLNIEYYEEDDENLGSLMSSLSRREDIDAIIGGLRSSHAEIMAKECTWNSKTLFTLATAEEMVRANSREGYLWAMTETNITECEVLLSKAESYGAKSVAMIVNGDDPYGKTFNDWFAFQAQEFGLEVKGIFPYCGPDAETVAKEALQSGSDAIICIPSEISDAIKMQSVLQNSTKTVLYSDTAFGADVLEQMGNSAEGMEGVAYISDPESGFDVTYRTYFEESPTLGEAQFYDALLMLGYGFHYQEIHKGTSLKTALRKIVSGKEGISTGWMSDGIANVLSKLSAGKSPDISGASGSLDFDSNVYTNVLATTYCHFKVYMGQYLHLDYYTSDGSNRTQSTTAGWNWKAENMQDFDEGHDISYPELDQRWALLVAGSDRWEDYRFQADVLAMYHFLKSAGYDDDHIVLIMEDNLAYHSSNPDKGQIRVEPEGENLYCNVTVDYRLSDLVKEDVRDIICGRSSARLQNVISSDSNDNVFVFWSGHGMPGTLCWGYSSEGIDAEMAREMFSGAEFRKMICFIETCYSGSVAKHCTGIPGLLFFTAANEYETSKADVFSPRLGVWMSNRFTASLRNNLTENPAVTLRDLYYSLFKSTVGSHVMIYNNDLYGNMFSNSMAEFAEKL